MNGYKTYILTGLAAVVNGMYQANNPGVDVVNQETVLGFLIAGAVAALAHKGQKAIDELKKINASNINTPRQ